MASQVILAWISSWHFRLRGKASLCCSMYIMQGSSFCFESTELCFHLLKLFPLLGFFFLDARHKHSGSIKNVTMTFSYAFSKHSSDCMKLQILNCAVTHFTYKSIATGLLMDCSSTVLWRLEQQLKDCRQTMICSEPFPLCLAVQ